MIVLVTFQQKLDEAVTESANTVVQNDRFGEVG